MFDFDMSYDRYHRIYRYHDHAEHNILNGIFYVVNLYGRTYYIRNLFNINRAHLRSPRKCSKTYN